jgi:hypothetical protein
MMRGFTIVVPEKPGRVSSGRQRTGRYSEPAAIDQPIACDIEQERDLDNLPIRPRLRPLRTKRPARPVEASGTACRSLICTSGRDKPGRKSESPGCLRGYDAGNSRAERQGFEPWVPLRAHWFSRPATQSCNAISRRLLRRRGSPSYTQAYTQTRTCDP